MNPALSLLLLAALLPSPSRTRQLPPVGVLAESTAFVANRGQWPTDIAFRSRSGPMTAWFDERGVVLDLVASEAASAAAAASDIDGAAPPAILGRATIGLRFCDALAVRPVGDGRAAGTTSYLRGPDPGLAGAHAPAFDRLRYEQIYPGIDAVFRRDGPRLAYDFHVAAGIAASAIEVSCDGAEPQLRADGTLCLRTAFGDVVHSAPRSFEVTADGRHVPVPSRFALRGDARYGFAVDRIDPSRALLIDPGISWSSFTGGTAATQLMAAAAVSGRLVAVAGCTDTPAPFPAPWNGNASAGGQDVLVALVDTGPAGQPLWTAVLGGALDDYGFDVAFDPATQLVTVVGMTQSPGFPVTANAYDGSFGGQWDAFVAMLDLAGNLVYASYLGTAGIDRLGAVVAAGGVLTLAGFTNSPAFPTTVGAYQPSLGGGHDLVVVKLDPTQPQLLYSTYLGGPSFEGFWNLPTYLPNLDLVALDVGSSGEVTVATRAGPAFPTTLNAYRQLFTGGPGADIVIARLDATLGTLLYGTYVGSTADDGVTAIDVDAQGVVALCGFAWNANFPATPGAPAPTWSGANDGVVVQLDPAQLPPAQQLRYGTFVGGAANDAAFDVAVEPSSGTIVVCGLTTALTAPLPTPGAHQATPASGATGFQGFVGRIRPNGAGTADANYLSYVSFAGARTDLLALARCDDGHVALAGHRGPNPLTSSEGLVAAMDLLPNGVTPVGHSSPPCSAPSYMQVSSQPLPGNAGFAFLCEGAPANAIALLVLGTPGPALSIPGLPGATLYLMPPVVTALQLSSATGLLELGVPLPPTLIVPTALAAQWFWFLPPLPAPCGGAITGASNALVF